MQGNTKFDEMTSFLIDESYDLEMVRKQTEAYHADDAVSARSSSSILNIHCETHKTMGIFFSKIQNKYMCFKCLLEEQELIYIDKKYKKQMEEFEAIKKDTAKCVQRSAGKQNAVKDWRMEIRKQILKVKSDFSKWIDHFTTQFITSLNNIDKGKDFSNFSAYASGVTKQQEELRGKYIEIIKIFTEISNADAGDKADLIESKRKRILQIQNEVTTVDSALTRSHEKLLEVQKKSVSLQGLELKILHKYISYFEKNIKKKFGNDAVKHHDPKEEQKQVEISPKNRQKSLGKMVQQIFSRDKSKDSKQTRELPQPRVISPKSSKEAFKKIDTHTNKLDSTKQTVQSATPKVSSRPEQMIQKSQPPIKPQERPNQQEEMRQKYFSSSIDISAIERKTLGEATGQSMIQELSKNDSQKTQMIKQSEGMMQTKIDNSNSIKSVRSSVSKQEERKNPREERKEKEVENTVDMSVSSRYRHKNQNSIYYLKPRSQDIYLLDFKTQGFVKEKLISAAIIPAQFSSIQVSSGSIFVIGGNVNDQPTRHCFEIDPNLLMEERAPMKTARSNAALTLIIDKFIFVIGGNLAKQKPTKEVEILDTFTGNWHAGPDLKIARSSTTACQLGNRYIYVFPGQASASQSTIEQLDIGASVDIKAISGCKWKQLHITNSEIGLTYAYGSSVISKTQILLFGGTNGTTYIFDTESLYTEPESSKKSVGSLFMKKKQEITMQAMKNSKMCCNAWFGYEADFTSRIFGNYLYSIDSYIGNLHVYSIKDKVWNYSALTDLGIK